MMKQFILTAAAFLYMAGPTANADDGTDWPDIPLLSITTEDGAFPTCEIVYPPEGCVGTGIEAEYVKGRLVMTLRKDTLYDSGEYVKDESGMRVKIRGNSTGASEGQKPYKIKLSKKFDMLCRGDEDYKEKDWNLLKISTWNPGFDGAESNFLTALGFIVSKAVGMEWTPGYKFVNLVMNDKYMGMYYLTDAVGRGDKRVDIKKSGYLIENDAYWWKEDAYFKTGKQAGMFGYTFKYPDSDDVDEPTTLNIQNYLNEFEEVLSDENGDVAEYIDLPMFARWIIAHDVLNSADEAGTNMYVYKNDFDEADPTSSKLKMGPLWDFDSAFKNPDDAGKWSKLHESSYFYYAELFKHEDFRKAYTDAWAEIKPGLLDNVKAGFNELKSAYGQSIDESMELHKTAYPAECQRSLQAQADELTAKISERISDIDMLTGQYVTGIGGIETASGKTQVVRIFDIYGTECSTKDIESLPKGVYIKLYGDGTAKKVLKRQ